MMVVGEGKKFVSALIVPAAEALKDWCDDNNVPCELHPSPHNETLNCINCISPETLKNEKVRAKFEEIIKAVNPEFKAGYQEEI